MRKSEGGKIACEKRLKQHTAIHKDAAFLKSSYERGFECWHSMFMRSCGDGSAPIALKVTPGELIGDRSQATNQSLL